MSKEAPGAGFEVIREEFKAVLVPGAEPYCIGTGFKFTEGPAWFSEGEFLLFSDIPDDTIFRWTKDQGYAAWRHPSHNANGNTVDGEGRLVTCEHGSRTVTRTDRDGTVVTLASTYAGRRLNSPNDVVVKSDGTIWFTDPPYGIQPEEAEQPVNYVFRLDPGSAEPVPVADDFSRPNGLCFSPEEGVLYIADSDHARHHVRRFTVGDDNTLTGGEVFVTIEPGAPDGIRTDRLGRLWSTAGDGVHAFSAAGDLLGKILIPETPANCCFGGPELRTLFITARTSVWAVELAVAGAR